LGVGQTLIGREMWDEAIERCEEALTRFNQSDDLIGQADTMLAAGLAHRNNGEVEVAASDFEQALTLYQQQQQPLGEADTRYERAGILIIQNNFEAAAEEFSRAIRLVEQVMQTLKKPPQWSVFLRQYPELYAQAAILQVRQNQDDQGLALLQAYTRIAGPEAVMQQLRAYAETVPTAGEGMSEAEIRTNKDLVRRLERLRKKLK
jgi:tetratricopeptide (TPR) repeat protein